jgi:hypothetical protein
MVQLPRQLWNICVTNDHGYNEAFDENDHDYIKSQKVNSRPIFIYAIRRV